MEMRKKILCIADAPGPVEFLAPVIPLFVRTHEVAVVGVQTAMHVLASNGAIECNDEMLVEDVYEKICPDLLISAISSLTHGPYVNNKFIEIAYRHHIPVISLQDYWGNHRAPHNRNIIKYLTGVCVPDDFAASLWREDEYKGDIMVTGNPGFDHFAAMDVEKERRRIRDQLHFKLEDRVILFAGQGTPKHIESDKITFAFVAEAIRMLAAAMPVKLIIRPHPRAIETAYYGEYARGIDVVDTSFSEFSDNVLPAADVVVSMGSTNLVHACYLRIPGVSVLLPEQGMMIFKNIGLDDFPPNILGATVGVYEENPEILQRVLQKIFSDGSFVAEMRAAQEKNFVRDAGSAQRVFDAIRNCIV